MRSVFLVISLFFFVQASKSNGSDFIFRQISPSGGLSSESVNTIIQDRHDFIWIGTNHGLLKYNNQSLNRFSNESEKNQCLINGFIHSMALDFQGNLWVATNSHICIQDEKTQTFSQFNYTDEDGPVIPTRIFALIADKTGYIWLADDKGVGRLNPSSGHLQRIELGTSDRPRELYCDAQNQIWTGTLEGHIYRIEASSMNAFRFPPSISHRVSAIYRDGDHIWIGSLSGGLHQFSLQGELQKKYDLNQAIGTPQDNWDIRQVMKDRDGNLWIATYQGLFIESPNGTLTWLDSNKKEGLPHSSTFTFYKDRQNGIWVGTWAGGLSYYHKANNQFINYSHSKAPLSLSNNIVSCFAQSKSGKIYVGTERGGINLFNKTEGTFSPVFMNEEKTSFNIKHQCFDNYGGHWVATKDNGLWYKAPDKYSYRQFPAGSEDGQHVASREVYSLFPVDSGLWIGTHGAGLNFYHHRTRRISFQKSLFPDGLPSLYPYIRSLIVDARSNLWVGTVSGLKCIPLIPGQVNTTAQNGLNIFTYTITETSNGQIWIGSKAGLVIYNPKEDVFTNINANGLLKNKSVYGIIEDHKHHIWITSNNGLIQYKPEFHTFRRYSTADGIQGLWFNPQSIFTDRDSLLYFGGTNGFTTVSPKNIKINTRPPKVIISRITINNTTDHYSFLANTDKERHHLKLTPDQTTLRFEFTSDNYLLPGKNKFQYRLVNYYDEWIDAGQDQAALFANLAWGTYNFEVKSCNNDGIWCLEPARLTITIAQPFYATRAAYALYLLSGAFAVFFLIRIKQARLKLKNDLLIQTIQHKQEEQLNEFKLRFFTNVSHEFKTPLSLITGPAQRLHQATNLTDEQKGMLDIIQRNSKRLLMLINQIIDLRKIEKGKEQLNLTSANIISFIRERSHHFTFDAQSKSINFIQKYPERPVDMEFDPEKLDYIIFNLLSNSFKYTSKNKQIDLSVYMGKKQPDTQEYLHHKSFGEMTSDAGISIMIKDQGTGIEPEDLERIFNRFEHGKTPLKNSSGIGLALCRDFTLLHKGQIHVFSTPGQGSCFVVHLPLKQEGQNIYFESHTPPLIGHEQLSTSSDVPQKQDTMLLIVEDNPDLRAYITAVLKPVYNTRTAENGKAALEVLKNSAIDLIVSDVMMPEMDGFEFCTRVKSDLATSHLPVILLTALSSTDNQITGMQLGADAYISKPFSDDLLISQINNLLTQREKMRQHFGSNIPASLTPEMNGLDNYFLNKLNDIIEENLTTDSFDIEQLTKIIGISRSQLHRKLKNLTNYSTSEYIRVYRLEKAIDLLKTGQYNIDEVAHVVGFNTHSYFTRCFKKQYNQSPKEFLAKLGRNKAE
ncbi:MAG: response regulator [Marinilabiliaceae bacterium]|nr:response regulator [Marinilabiliaceae bacterium]